MSRSSTERATELSLLEMLRWGWRQLTSMRTALLLLLLLQATSPGAGNRSSASSIGNIDDSNLDGFVHMNMIDDLLTE